VDLGPGRIASEMVFVPADGAAGEDDGWLMGYVYDAARGASDLVILDAHDFGRPVATVHLPARVPQGFHGNWIPDSALA
jgi:carotenoid cleavage oxygenase